MQFYGFQLYFMYKISLRPTVETFLALLITITQYSIKSFVNKYRFQSFFFFLMVKVFNAF